MTRSLLLALLLTLATGCAERTLWTVGICVRAGTADVPPTYEKPATPQEPMP